MRILLAILLSALTAQAAHVQFNFRNFVAGNVTNRPFAMQPLSTPLANNGGVVISEPLFGSTTNGTLTVSNVVAGLYRCTVTGFNRTNSAWTILVPETNTVVDASTLQVSGSTNVSGSVAYSASAADGRFVTQVNGVFRGSTNVFFHTNAAAGSFLKTDGSNAFWGVGSGTVPDPLRLGNGSSNAPAFSFTGDTTTGVYRVSAGILGLAGTAVYGKPGATLGDQGAPWLYGNFANIQILSNNNTVTAGFESNGRAYAAKLLFDNVWGEGTAALPALTWVQDPDTGLYLGGPNLIGISAGGVKRATIESAAFSFFNSDGDQVIALNDDGSIDWGLGAGQLTGAGGGTFSSKISFLGTDHTGLRLQNLTTTQRDATTPAEGDLIWNSSAQNVQVYRSGGWQTLAGGGGTADPLRLGLGSSTSPTYSFSAKTNTGICADSSGNLLMTVNGLQTLLLSFGDVYTGGQFRGYRVRAYGDLALDSEDTNPSQFRIHYGSDPNLSCRLAIIPNASGFAMKSDYVTLGTPNLTYLNMLSSAGGSVNAGVLLTAERELGSIGNISLRYRDNASNPTKIKFVPTSSQAQIQSADAATIYLAFDDDATTYMGTTMDAQFYQILNLPDPSLDTEPVTLGYFNTHSSAGSGAFAPRQFTNAATVAILSGAELTNSVFVKGALGYGAKFADGASIILTNGGIEVKSNGIVRIGTSNTGEGTAHLRMGKEAYITDYTASESWNFKTASAGGADVNTVARKSDIYAATNNIGLEVGNPVNTNCIRVTLQTTDNTTNTIYSFTPRQDSCVRVVAEIVGFNSTNSASYQKAATFRNNGGTISQVGSTGTFASAEDDAAFESLIDLSGAAVRIRVAGDTGRTVNWTAYIRLYYSQ